MSVDEIDRLVRDCRDCGGTGKREDEQRRPTRAACTHESVLGSAVPGSAALDIWRRSGHALDVECQLEQA